jgi:hypothetical protein
VSRLLNIMHRRNAPECSSKVAARTVLEASSVYSSYRCRCRIVFGERLGLPGAIRTLDKCKGSLRILAVNFAANFALANDRQLIQFDLSVSLITSW